MPAPPFAGERRVEKDAPESRVAAPRRHPLQGSFRRRSRGTSERVWFREVKRWGEPAGANLTPPRLPCRVLSTADFLEPGPAPTGSGSLCFQGVVFWLLILDDCARSPTAFQWGARAGATGQNGPLKSESRGERGVVSARSHPLAGPMATIGSTRGSGVLVHSITPLLVGTYASEWPLSAPNLTGTCLEALNGKHLGLLFCLPGANPDRTQVPITFQEPLSPPMEGLHFTP